MNQLCFIIGKSLSTTLDCIDIISEYLMDGNDMDIMYLDFSKAFDTESHDPLLVKMKNLAISKNKIANIVRYF